MKLKKKLHCWDCGKYKTRDNFYRINKFPNKRESRCKECKLKAGSWLKVRGRKSYYWAGYRRNAKDRNIEWSLTKKEFDNFWKAKCYYCGKQIEYLGIDRMNNKEGYTVENSVSCCETCNRMKYTHTKEEFIQYCKIIAKRWG